MPLCRRALCALLFAFLLFPADALAQRTLYWRALDVQARLDADGALHIVERHAMVFTGDWNGGERIFRVLPGQQLTLDGIKRVEPLTGAAVDLVNGNIALVDHYLFTDGNTLRWRSRLPSSSAFNQTELVYEIAYTLTGILLHRGDVYTLDHNFALPDASWPIVALSVDIDLDPAWVPPPGFARHRTAGPLSPGSNFTVHAELHYAGRGAPGAVRTSVSPSTRLALFGGLLAAVGVIAVAFVRRESSLGRFTPIPAIDSIDEAWLDARVFNLRPEEAGALWDDTVGPPEVAAVLARLTGERKIETWTVGDELSMRLKQPLDAFDGYEKTLLSALFHDGVTETSTSRIKSHYAGSGFDPAAQIRGGLTAALETHQDFHDLSAAPSARPTLLLFGAGLALLAAAYFTNTIELGTLFRAPLTLLFAWLLGLFGAFVYSERIDRLGALALAFAWVPVLFLVRAALDINSISTTPLILIVAILLLQIAVVNNVFNVATTRQGPKKLARRRELAAARRYFAHELDQPQPRIRDEWFPWLVAFDLGPDVGRWFQAYGGASRSPDTRSRSWDDRTDDSSPSSSTDATFTGGSFIVGGGGRSGGGGATGTWAVAAGALASGVSKSSSSRSSDDSGSYSGGSDRDTDSSSGDSGSSGSSGGGGGGGW